MSLLTAAGQDMFAGSETAICQTTALVRISFSFEEMDMDRNGHFNGCLSQIVYWFCQILEPVRVHRNMLSFFLRY